MFCLSCFAVQHEHTATVAERICLLCDEFFRKFELKIGKFHVCYYGVLFFLESGGCMNYAKGAISMESSHCGKRSRVKHWLTW